MIADKIRKFIIEELAFDPSGATLTDDYPLIERHVLDSLGIFNLVRYIEDEFGVVVADEDLVPEHFGTISGIAALVEAKRPA